MVRMDYKTYRIYHLTPKKYVGLLIIPVGAYYNRKIQTARRGDFIMFDDDNKRKYSIIRVAQLDLNSQIATLLVGYVYSSTIDVVVKRWQSTAIIQGYAKNSISRNKCLVIEYNELPVTI